MYNIHTEEKDIKDMRKLWSDISPYLRENISVEQIENDKLFKENTPKVIMEKYEKYKEMYDDRYKI